MSAQPATDKKKKGGLFRALLWALVLGALAGIIAYVVGLGIASLLSYSGAGQLIAGQLLSDFGYKNASTAITGIATGNIYQAATLPYVLTLLGIGVGAGVGYFKGKREDEEES
jgi:ABC-type sugar transport system permease subunit